MARETFAGVKGRAANRNAMAVIIGSCKNTEVVMHEFAESKADAKRIKALADRIEAVISEQDGELDDDAVMSVLAKVARDRIGKTTDDADRES